MKSYERRSRLVVRCADGDGDRGDDLSSTGLFSLSRTDTVKNRVSIGTVQRLEEFGGLGVCIQRRLKIVRHRCRTCRRIGDIPPPIRFRRFDLRKSGGTRPALRLQSKRARSIDL